MSHAHPRRPYDLGMSVEAKPEKGLGGWRTAIVEHDDGGGVVGVRVAGRRFDVPRSRVRLPKETRAPRRVLISVAAVAAKGPAAQLPPLGPARIVRTHRRQAAAQPKPRGRVVDDRYRAFVRTWPCCSCGSRENVQASHHGPRPTGRKTHDSRCVPLCWRCHLGPGGFHDTGRLPGYPALRGEGLRAFLLDKMIELLTEYFWGDGEDGDGEEPRGADEAEHEPPTGQ